MSNFKILIITTFCMITSLAISQSVRPLRFGVKIGAPSLFTANIEYLTPLLDDRVSIIVDYMSLNPSVDDVVLDYSNFEIGTNVYLNNTGKGLYAGISYFSFDAEGTYPDVDFDNGSFGEGLGEIDFNTFNVKLGLKLGRTVFTRFEVGYGFGTIPDAIEVNSIDGNGTTIEEIPGIPGLSSSGTFLFSFGIGFAIL